jgi:gliding motility-associated-like protein
MVTGSNGCTAEISTFLDTEPIDDEDIEFLGDTIIVCPGDTTFLLASPDSTLMYTWTPEDGLIFTDGDTSNPQFTFAEGETMAVFSVVASDGVCSRDGGEVVILLYQEMEDTELAFDIVPMCGTTTVCFMNNSAPADGNYEFDFGNEGGLIDSMGDMICYTYPDFGLFQVTLTYLGVCEDSSLMRNVIVAPDVDINIEGDSLTYCAGDEVTLTATSEDDGTVVEWFNEDNELIGEDFVITYLPEGDELLTVIGFNAGGCFDTAMIQLTEYRFDLTLNVPEIVCVGDDTVISVTDNTNSNLTYVWTPEGSIVGSNEGPEVTINISEDTEFTLTATNEVNGCSIDTSFTATVSTVSAEIEADPIEVFQCNPTDIGVIDDDPDFTYEWNTGATTPTFTTDTLLETTSFSVTVTDENGCTAEASISINVLIPECDDTDVFLPTAFTPNGDNLNDVLKLESNYVKKMKLEIYTRWGELVYSTTDPDAGWDGTFDGAELAPDVYAYNLSATCSNDAVYTKMGNITLIR